MFRSKNASKNSELAFQFGRIAGEWVALDGAEDMSDTALEAASDSVGAMVFARPEDGAFNLGQDERGLLRHHRRHPSGENTGNALGSLRLNPSDPTKNATLSIAYNADEVIAAGGDIAISPDNIDVSSEYLMINEDGTGNSRPVMAAKGRDGSIWRFELRNGEAARPHLLCGSLSSTRRAETALRSVQVSGRPAESSRPPASSGPTRGSSTSRPIVRPHPPVEAA